MSDEFKITMRVLGIAILLISITIAIGITIRVFHRAESTIDGGIRSYERFFELREQADAADAQIGLIYDTPSSDPSFDQFSKSERVNAAKRKLLNIIADYNAQSSAWTIGMWKSDKLPYTLNTSLFPNYTRASGFGLKEGTGATLN